MSGTISFIFWTALIVYAFGSVMWALIYATCWYDEHGPYAERDDRKRYAQMFMLTPVWPLLLATRVVNLFRAIAEDAKEPEGTGEAVRHRSGEAHGEDMR